MITFTLIIILLLIIIVLAIIGIHKQAQISSLKNQIKFLQINLELLTKKENKDNMEIEEKSDSN